MTKKKAATRRTQTEKTPEIEEVFTQSRINTMQECPRKEYLQYRAGEGFGIEGTEPFIPFLEGELGHYALAYWWENGRMLRKNLLSRLQKIIDRFKDAKQGIDPALDDKLRTALTAVSGACLGYKEFYAQDRQRYELLFAEEQFELPFNVDDRTVVFRGKLDMGTRNKETDRLAFWEHKFLSAIPQGMIETLPLNIQGLVYILGFEQITGKLPDDHIWDIVLKTRMRPKKTSGGGVESQAQFEARVQDSYTKDDSKYARLAPPMSSPEAIEGVRTLLEDEIRAYFAEKDQPRMRFSSCLGRYGQPCMFAPACRAKLEGKRDGWDAPECAGLYRPKKVQHAELVIE